ncbi:MAG: hypothetical protein O7J95_20245 [Planctomycetota bacterium]|nr:hypothetical protein [Planctomycetota bacterium]
MARRLPGLERSALVGAAVWPLAVFGLGLELPAALLLLAPLVLVPLGLGLVPEAGGGELVG